MELLPVRKHLSPTPGMTSHRRGGASWECLDRRLIDGFFGQKSPFRKQEASKFARPRLNGKDTVRVILEIDEMHLSVLEALAERYSVGRRDQMVAHACHSSGDT